ncbi:hypothetical protein JHK86_029731 [Glycine max]|nr:hypothetical protein JHK86_029731 [Glycine max]
MKLDFSPFLFLHLFFVDDSFCHICCKEIHPAHQGTFTFCLHTNLYPKFPDLGLMLNIKFKDDIGDKSVFMFNSLPAHQRKALLDKLQQQKNQN